MHLAVLVEVEAVGVAAALREQLEPLRLRVVAPDALLELEHLLRVGRVLDLRGHGAALGAVEPAVRPPLQRVGVGVRVLHAEAR